MRPNGTSAAVVIKAKRDLALSQILNLGDSLPFCPSLTYKTEIYQTMLFLAWHIYTIWYELSCHLSPHPWGDFGAAALLSGFALPNTCSRNTRAPFRKTLWWTDCRNKRSDTQHQSINHSTGLASVHLTTDKNPSPDWMFSHSAHALNMVKFINEIQCKGFKDILKWIEEREM